MTKVLEVQSVEASLTQMLLEQTPVDIPTLLAVFTDSVSAKVKEARAFDVLIARKGDITEKQVAELVEGLRKTGKAADKLRVTAEVVMMPGVVCRKATSNLPGESYDQVLSAVQEVARKGHDLTDIVPAVAAAVTASPKKEVSLTAAANAIKAVAKRKVAKPTASKELSMSVKTIKGQTVRAVSLVKAGETLTEDDRKELEVARNQINDLLGESK